MKEEVTLESLAQRVAALERALDVKPPQSDKNGWRRVVGMFDDSDFMRQVDEECLWLREAEREVARRGESAE